MSNGGNGHDLLDDDDERMHRATLVARMREQARETIERSEALVERLRMEAPSSDAATYTPREPEQPEPQQANAAGLAAMVVSLRAEFDDKIETRIEILHGYVQELLELCAGDFARQWTGEVDNLAKIVTNELRELRSAIAQAGGRASGELEAARSEIERSKAQIEALRVEVAALRTDLDQCQQSLTSAWSRLGDESRRKLEAVR